MKVLIISIIIAVFSSSCASIFPKEKSLSSVKAGLVCVPYEKGMRLDTVYWELGKDPDIIARSEQNADPDRYVMGYQKATLLLNVQKQEIREGKTVRFPEVVTGLEICRKK